MSRSVSDRPAPSRRSRRWCVPPPVVREPGETLEGVHVLAEFPGPLGLLLWQSLRDATLWAETTPAARAGLFHPDGSEARLAGLGAAGLDPVLDLALTSLAALTGDPGAARPAEVSGACLQAARWAEGRGALGTALSFAQAAALASPAQGRPALDAAELAMQRGEPARAESWLRRAVALARRGEDWEVFGRAHVALADLQRERGRRAEARALLLKAHRAARRHALREVRGAALRRLFRLAVEEGDAAEAERLARSTLRVVGRTHPAAAEILHDLAAVRVAGGEWRRALALLRRVLPQRDEPEARIATLALLARAAAGAGEREAFRDAWAEAWHLLRHVADDRTPAAALAELARAAAAMRDWRRMEQATSRARALHADVPSASLLTV